MKPETERKSLSEELPHKGQFLASSSPKVTELSPPTNLQKPDIDPVVKSKGSAVGVTVTVETVAYNEKSDAETSGERSRGRKEVAGAEKDEETCKWRHVQTDIFVRASEEAVFRELERRRCNDGFQGPNKKRRPHVPTTFRSAVEKIKDPRMYNAILDDFQQIIKDGTADDQAKSMWQQVKKKVYPLRRRKVTDKIYDTIIVPEVKVKQMVQRKEGVKSGHKNKVVTLDFQNATNSGQVSAREVDYLWQSGLSRVRRMTQVTAGFKAYRKNKTRDNKKPDTDVTKLPSVSEDSGEILDRSVLQGMGYFLNAIGPNCTLQPTPKNKNHNSPGHETRN